MKSFLFFVTILFSYSILIAQTTNYKQLGTLHRLKLNNAPFPDTERDSGHVYRNNHYSQLEHYNDSTTLVFIPDYLELENEIDIVVYFHGWNNNVDSVLSKFNLIEQFHSSSRKGVLVMPEGPKNAPDSFGGKLEETGRFKLFVDEVITKLKNELELKLDFKNISLAGHSGAYRVIAYILLRGGVTESIKEIIIFDGLYGDVEKYSYWLDHFNGRFINIYTLNGGTKRESENLMKCLESWGIPFAIINEDSFTKEQLRSERIIFISSSLSHNEVISSQNQFKRFLRTN